MPRRSSPLSLSLSPVFCLFRFTLSLPGGHEKIAVPKFRRGARLGNRATFTENLSRPRLAPCQNHG